MKKVEMYKVIKARSGVNSIVVKQTGENPYHLHSTVDPIQEANEWVRQIEIEECTVYIVLGCGLGYHVRTLWDKIPQNSLLVVILTASETTPAIQQGIGVLYNFVHERFSMYEESAGLYDLAVVIAQSMVEFNVKKIKICNYYPAVRMASDFYASCEESLSQLIGEKMTLSVNVNLCTGGMFIENYWRNIPYIATNPGVATFKNVFKGWPCIVVAGGPSLNKNIKLLKECLPYAVVIAAGSTMGALHKHGITPHFLVVCDGTLDMFNCLEGYCNDKTVLLASTEVYHEVVSKYPGRRCFTYTMNDGRDIFVDCLPKTERLRQTASVATVAVDFAHYCGAEQIIMVGQDLAIVGDNYHADGITTTGYADHEVLEVPGYYGEMITSIPSFKIVIEYLEVYVGLAPEVRFINATEGGAKLAGMEQLSLAEVKDTVLGEILPIENKIDRIFKEFVAEGFNLNPLINVLQQYERHCGDVLQLLNNYAEEHPDFEKISTDPQDLDVMIVKLEEIMIFFTKIKNHIAAPSYKIYLNPRLQLAEFYRQDKEPLAIIYQVYAEIFRVFQEFIIDQGQWISENIDFFKKIVNRVDSDV